ncbi:synaptonemal complex protein 2 isoform X3 [Chiroxiphia lanceolata]|uniref:synaptonemal complex protein 2 isoform X3 n=1 Tax=Chiroxiphia lanceolata TaxID=296741 RepID=UPI0013CE9A85|nr:synaptonemal complex protein 2 isoform X3 [Chiroxiphia lanceolata]
MTARSEMQLEKLIDEATRKKDSQLLEKFLATENSENVSYKGSKQFVNKLDKLLCRELDKQEVKSVSTLLNVIQKCGEKISIAGEDGLPALMKYGLVGRMVNWFEKLKGILVLRGNERNEMLTSLAEDFFNVLLAVCESRPEGKMQILENFVLRTCSLITDVRISIYVQQEVVRKLNLMLDNIPREAKKKLFSTKEMLLVMSEMGRRILDAGDYDMQVAITEALCRMISEKQRAELASQWFSMEFVSNAFKGIKDSEFETDCRKFLNQVNGMLGDKRRVFTYPCLAAALDKYELQFPLDENLEEFWIDFNVGSKSISFYVAADDAGQQWETVIIPEEEVNMYSLEEKDSKKLLTIDLKSPMNVGNLEGEKFSLYFNSILEIKDVTRKIYGFNKCKEGSKKQTASVAKTAVHVLFDESGSQVMVPESQLSPGLKEKSEREEKVSKKKTQQLPESLRTQNKNNSQEKCRGDSSKITPSRTRKMSEASVIVPGTTRTSTRSPLTFVSTSTPFKGRFKLPLEMTSSTKRSDSSATNETRTKISYQDSTGRWQRLTLDDEFFETEQIRRLNTRNEAKAHEKQKCAEEVLKFIQEATEEQTLDEVFDIVPDSQPVGKSNKPLLPGLMESSFDRTETWKKRTSPLPEKSGTTGDKQKPNPSVARPSHPARVADTSLHSELAKEEPEILLRKEPANSKPSKPKPKSKEISEAAKSLISKISDRYKDKSDEKSKARDSLGLNRTYLNKSWNSKEEVQDRILKTTSFLNITAGHIMDDVYNFKLSGFDEPTIKLGVQELHVTELSVHTETTKKGNAVVSKSSTELKGTKKARNNQDKKHLFSDSDTENRGDDSKTEISWLQESKRKPKPQIVNYSRNKKLGKPISTDKSYVVTPDESPEAAFHMEKPKGKNAKKKKVNKCKKQNSRTAEMTEQTSRKKLPRRAAAAKNYKEPSSSESESEGQIPPCTSKEEKSKLQKPLNGAIKDYKQQKAPQVLSVEPKRGENCVQKPPEKSKNPAEQKEMEVPSAESPASLETMRCAEGLSEGNVTPEHTSSERSLGLRESSPENREMLNSKKGITPNDFCPQNKNIHSMCANQSPEAIATKSTFGKKSFSPVLTEASLLSLTTYKTVSGKNSKGAGLETCNSNEGSSFQRCFSDTIPVKGKPKDTTKAATKSKEELSLTTYKPDSGKHAKGAVSETRNNNEDTSFQFCFSDTLSVKGKLQDATKALTKSKEGCEPPSPLSASSGSKAQSSTEEPYDPVNESGPTVQPFLKRRYHSDTESSSEEAQSSKEEENTGRRRISLKPKKLFKTNDAAAYRVSESISTRSLNELSALDGQFWEPGCSTLSICQKLQKEFTKKIENRSRKMDHFNKQTLKAAHQHLTTMSYQLHECRIRQLDKFHFTLVEELENFEKDSQSLKNMEKEFTTFWKKQTSTLSTYMKNEQQRIQVLKTSFEKNIYHSVDYEERIFTSEMHLMKEDIKGIQEKLLKEMKRSCAVFAEDCRPCFDQRLNSEGRFFRFLPELQGAEQRLGWLCWKDVLEGQQRAGEGAKLSLHSSNMVELHQ